MEARKIELKTVAMELREEQKEADVLDYRKLLTEVMRVQQQGMSFEDMEIAVRVIGDLKRANGAVLIQESDYEYLWKRVQALRPLVADPALLEFRNAVRDAPKVVVEAKG